MDATHAISKSERNFQNRFPRELDQNFDIHRTIIIHRGLRKFHTLWRTPYGRFFLGLYDDDVLTLKSTRSAYNERTMFIGLSYLNK